MGALPMASLLPEVGMEFSTIDEAWMFWISYEGSKEFEVRKRYTNKIKSNEKVMSCRHVCVNEGHRKEDKRDHLKKSVQELKLNRLSSSHGSCIGLA